MNSMKPPIRTKASRQAGATLIEVLVSVLIFSFGLLGLIGLQSQAMQFSGDAEGTNRAAALASEITTHMSTLRSGDMSSPAANPIYLAWQAKVNDPVAGLPNGAGTVAYAAGVATIDLSWTAPNNPLPRRYSTQFVDPPAGGITFP